MKFRQWRPDQLGLNEKEVLRQLGYRKGSLVPPRVRKMLQQALLQARGLLAPRGLWTVLPAEPFRKSSIFWDAEFIAFGLVTVGRALENEAQQFFRDGLGTKGLFLDAIGSVAVEETAEFLNQELAAWAHRRGLHLTRRFSPGYSGWEVEGQRLLFAHLEGERIGVTLLPSCMMIPLKSISFACKAGREGMDEINKGGCLFCPLRGRCGYEDEGDCRGVGGNGC